MTKKLFIAALWAASALLAGGLLSRPAQAECLQNGKPCLPVNAATESTQTTLFKAGQAIGALPAGANVIGGVTQSGTWAVTQGTAANLNATVVGTGTFVTQATTTGPVAAATTASGNPVPFGCDFNTLPTYTNGQRTICQADASGNLRARMTGTSQTFADGSTNTGMQILSSSSSSTSSGLAVYDFLFNGTTWDRARGDTNGAYMVGNVASGATDASNPVKIGGRYNSTTPTLTDGQRGDAQLDTRGSMKVALIGANSANSVNVSAGNTDAKAASTGIDTNSSGMAYNGTNWDRVRTITGADGTGLGVVAVDIAPTSASAAAITPAVSASAAATSLVLKGSAGNYYDGYCQPSVAGRCILYNATSAPGAGALTAALVLECVTVAAGGQGGWQYNNIPRRASVGMVILFSSASDCNTYTASSTAYIHGSSQ